MLFSFLSHELCTCLLIHVYYLWEQGGLALSRQSRSSIEAHLHGSNLRALEFQLLVSGLLILEQREYLRDGVDQASIYLSPCKPTEYY